MLIFIVFQLTWLKIEQRLVDLDIELKKCLSVENPDIGMALDFLEELATTSVSQLMFKKQPQVVETIRYASSEKINPFVTLAIRSFSIRGFDHSRTQKS